MTSHAETKHEEQNSPIKPDPSADFNTPQKASWTNRFFTIFVSGTGFLSDSYDLFVINIALAMMKQNKGYGTLTADIQAQISIMAIVGALAGQAAFGAIGDQFGRKATFITTAALTIFGCVAQVCAQPSSKFSIWQQMMLFRFFMGMGVGGEYPMASTITSENSLPEHRGRNLAAVFSMQGVGRVLCALMLMVSAFCIKDTNWQWRFAILMGAVPMIAVFYFRWAPETDHFRHDVLAHYPSLAQRVKNTWERVWDQRFKLMGTAGSWFLVDVVFYGNSLFSADVTKAMGTESTLKGKSLQNFYIQMMAMPGYILAVMFLDAIGRKNLQMFGFIGEGVIFILMAIFQHPLKHIPGLFVVLYALTFFFDDFGPNTTTFVIPAEIFPTAARSTCHGLSAAFGKAGAAIGGTVFLRLTNLYCPEHTCTSKTPTHLQDKGIRLVFICCGVIAFFGAMWTWLFVDDRPHRSLEQETAPRYHDLEAAKSFRRLPSGKALESIKESEMTNQPQKYPSNSHFSHGSENYRRAQTSGGVPPTTQNVQ